MTQQITFQIERFKPGSDRQKEVGIFGSFSILIKQDDKILVSLDDAKLMRTKDGSNWYIESPFEIYGQAGEKKKKRYWRLLPDKEEQANRDALVQQAKQAYEKAAGATAQNKDNQPSQPARSNLWE